MSDRNFFAELKRRNVYKVAVAYIVIAWLLIQAASILFPTFEAPSWVMKVFVVFLVLGFPPVLIFSWAFEITPEGLKREDEIAADNPLTRRTGRKIVGVTVIIAVLAAGLLIFQLARPKITGKAVTNGDAAMPEIPAKSIAVLPFDNLSEDKSNAFFAEGVQDEILTRLAKVADLKVISRTSTQKYKSAPDNLREIAKQLGVMHVVEGSVQKSADQVRVNVQLINAITDAHLWADTYDRKLTDIFTVETEIAKTIADMLQAKLSGSEQMMMAKRPTENPEAHELYVRGRFFWNKRTAADLWKSIDYFNQAIAKDPNYAPAYAGEAQAWIVLSAYNGGTPADSYPQAEAFAQKALALDNTSSEALVGLASFKARYQFDFAGALQDYERAIQLNPNDATAHHWLAVDCFGSTGNLAREVAEMKRALELDPLSLIIHSNLGSAYLHQGRLDEASTQFRKAIEMDGTFYSAQQRYGQVLELQGKIPEAVAQSEKAAALTDDPMPLGYLGRIYAIAGRKDEARQILERLRRLRSQRYTSAYALALVAIGLDDKTEAVHWLEEGYRDRDGDALGTIRVDPVFIPLHGDPRFEALAEKIVPARLFKAPPK